MAIQPVPVFTIAIGGTTAIPVPRLSQSDELKCGAAPPTAGIGKMICLLFGSPAAECIVRGFGGGAGDVTVGSWSATKTVWSRWSVFASTIPSTSGPVILNGAG